MMEKDILAAVLMARWLLDARDPQATFAAMLPSVKDKTACTLDEGELFGLAMAIAGFGAIVRGDFKDVPTL